MRVLDLFSGIGGFSLGLERAGLSTVAFCEIEEYPRRVLAQHWPDVPIYNDVTTLTKERLDNDGISVDVICGGFPCQDISLAGEQQGISEDTRSGLWSECARLLGELRPKYAIFENVTNLLAGYVGDWFKRILWDISKVGYDAEWHCIPASQLGANHHRDRVWIIAYPQRERLQGSEKAGNIEPQGSRFDKLFTRPFCSFRQDHTHQPIISGKSHGIPDRVDRVKSLGNAVVPQIPELIGRALMALKAG